jgi:hypothetical protein
MMKNMNEPIVGGQYEWQGMPCAISNVEPPRSPLNFYKHLVTVEYFDKVTKRWSSLKTPFDGTFKLIFQPHHST